MFAQQPIGTDEAPEDEQCQLSTSDQILSLIVRYVELLLERLKEEYKRCSRNVFIDDKCRFLTSMWLFLL